MATIIGIAGGTASGKTTVASKIYEATKQKGSVVMLRLDDYYKSHDEMSFDERRKINFDHPDAYDVNLLISQIKDLLDGKSIQRPTYDFNNHTRSNIYETLCPANVIIIEGIMTFAIKEIRDLCNIKIFVDTPDDIRFIRRLERDIKYRSRTYDSVIKQYLDTVRPMHMAFVEPSKCYSDIIIPTGGENEIAIDIIVSKITNLL